MFFKKNKVNHDSNLKYISNIIYLLDKLKHDKANIEHRKEIAINLEILNNNSDALFHLFIAFELNPNDNNIILSIIRNLLKMNDIYEARKWIIKLDNIDNKMLNYQDKIYDKFEYKKIICIGNKIKNLPFSITIDDFNSLSDLAAKDLNLNLIEIIFLFNDDMKLLDELINNFMGQLISLKFIFSVHDKINNTVLQKSFIKIDNFDISNLIPSMKNINFFTFIKSNE